MFALFSYSGSSSLLSSFLFSCICHILKPDPIIIVAVDILKTTMVDKLPSDLEGMEASMEHLLALIDDVYKYVDEVVVRYKDRFSLL